MLVEGVMTNIKHCADYKLLLSHIISYFMVLGDLDKDTQPTTNTDYLLTLP